MSVRIADPGLRLTFQQVAGDGYTSIADAHRLVASAKDGRGLTATETRDLQAIAAQADRYISQSARSILMDAVKAPSPVIHSKLWDPTVATAQSVRDEWRAASISYPRNPNVNLPPVREETGARAANPFKLQFSIVAGERRIAVLEDDVPASMRPVPSDDDRPAPQRRAIRQGNPGFWLSGQREIHESILDVPEHGIATRQNDYLFSFDWAARTVNITRYDQFYGTVDAPGREQATNTVVTKWSVPMPDGF